MIIRNNTYKIFAKLNRILISTTDIRDLLRRISYEIARIFKAEQAFVFIYSEAGSYASVGTDNHARLPLADARAIEDYILDKGVKSVVLDKLPAKNEDLRRLLVSHKIAVIIPLFQSNKIIGYLCLGRRRGHYSGQDTRFLNTVADELAIAVQNALSVHKVRELNKTLQQRINEATSELRASNAQLRRLDQSKDEFVSLASHQLRTPLTSVKGYIDMVLEGDAGEVTPAQRKLLQEAFASSERMVHLIGDFLSVSRLQAGKFVIDKQPTDLIKLVGRELDSLKSSATRRNLKFAFKAPAQLPRLMLDAPKIRQVVVNFVDNALYYSREGTTIRVKLAEDNGDLVLTVQDSGIGVPKDEQGSLFTKFFRASNARRRRPDGTGVGLYLAQKIINLHGGSIVFESVEGQGSTFGFRLPIDRLRADDTHQLNNQPDH